MRWLPPTRPLSPHFKWGEVIRNSGYSRLPYGPTPIGLGRVVMTPRRNAREHAGRLEWLRMGINVQRQQHGLPPTYLNVISWARSYAHNKAVGGAGNSQHLYFRATDISVQEIERVFPWAGGRADFDGLLEVVFAEGGVGLYPAGNRHVDSRGSRARWTVA